MKKFILLLIVLSIALTTISAATITSAVVGGAIQGGVHFANTKKELDSAGKTFKGLDDSFATVDVSTLNEAERVSLYEELKQKSFGASMVGLFAGFGIGSGMVGDLWGLSFGLIGDGIAWGVLGVAAAVWFTDFLMVRLLTLGQSKETTILTDIALYTAIGGAVILAVSHIIQAILPPIHVASYNAKLRNHLGLSKDLKIAIVPGINNQVIAVASIQF